MQHVHLCPHCGQPTQPKTTDWNYSEWRITTQFGSIVLTAELQVKIFDILWRKQNIKGITRERLMDILYINEINGGPQGYWGLNKAIQKLRAKLLDVGIFIQAANGRSREGYSLIFTTPEQAKGMKV